MAITLTDRAARKIKHIFEKNEMPADSCLRVGVKGGGCSGFSYSLDLTEAKSDQDEMFDCNGVNVVCDPKSYLYLNGTSVDFRDEIMGRGFVFNNPNASSSCGCGSSFSA